MAARRIHAFCACALMTALAGCGDAPIERPELTHQRYAEQLAEVGADRTLLGGAWLEAARDALLHPLPVTLPYAEAGGFVAHDATALGLSFTGVAEQRVLVELVQSGTVGGDTSGRLFVELFRVDAREDRVRHVWLAALPAALSRLEVELPEDATYVVRIQPELAATAQYRVTIEASAALRFPVNGLQSNAVQSYFGAERDAGARHHEGVDIFAPRSTPVLAVASGLATPRVNRLGGNTVWLSTAGTSYYYAHLESAAISAAQRVHEGDVLGYVGNSGNAASTVPHLHFGVYRWGRGAVDPLPLLGAHHFEDELSPATFAPHYGVTTANELHLRRAPSRQSASITRLPAHSIVHAMAASGEWLRVRLAESRTRTGWIHRRYQTELHAPLRAWRAPSPGLLRDSIDSSATPIDFIAAGVTLDVLAERDANLLLRDSATSRIGWWLMQGDQK
jgi:murein DD-endopeptidase MepM/ murein hydrolase activator NlpD